MWGCTLPRTPLLSYSCGPLPEKSMTDLAFSAIMIPSFFLGATGMLCVAMARSTLPIVIAGALKAVSQGAAQPAIQAYSIRYLGKERAGVATSTCYIGQDLGNSIAPILGSFVVTNWSYTVLYSGYGAMLLVLGLGCYFAQRRLERKKTQSSDWKNIERRRLLAYNGREPLRKGVSILWQN